MRLKINRKMVPVFITLMVFILVYGTGSFMFRGFFSMRVFTSLFTDKSFVGIAAVGMTFVIITGGIDLSVAGVIALTSVLLAKLMAAGVDPFISFFIVLVFGTVLGLSMGSLIRFFKLPPFLVTLVGMFFSRGLAFAISTSSIPIYNPLVEKMALFRILTIGHGRITLVTIMFLSVALAGMYLLHFTRFGRYTYALGGDEESALLLGVPVGRTKVLVYTFNGFLSAFAGIAYTFYITSGYAGAAPGLELDVIASVVVGGTLLVGGFGYIEGTVIGVLILGLVRTIIDFQGNLNVWWAQIVTGLLVLIFVLIQTFVTKTSTRD